MLGSFVRKGNRQMIEKRGEYIGEDPMLLECTAILRSKDWSWDTVMAQFDWVRGSTGLTIRPGDLDPSTTSLTAPCKFLFGWHQFAKSDFKILDRDF